MQKHFVVAVTVVVMTGCVHAQTAAASARPEAPARISITQAISMAGQGRCQEALPVLRAGVPKISDKEQRLSAAMAQARCGMSLDDYGTAVAGLLQMKRDAPRNPEVLYVWAHYFSQIGNRAAQELANIEPDSVQAHRLEAEALEAQGKGDEAIAIYRRILEKDPNARDVHFRIAQILLNAPVSGQKNEEAAHAELDAELRLNPYNAAAEFILGELSRRAGQWEPAIEHFARAAKFDAGFIEASLALGMSLNAAGKFVDAIPPLERYVKAAPADPAGHYQLAMAYARTGNREAAMRETELQRQAAEKKPVITSH
jgi:predicted Zn-dependent protease